MSMQTSRPDRGTARRREWRHCLAACAILLCATGLVVAHAPAALWLVALPTLVIVPGHAAVRLVYGARDATTQDPATAPAEPSADPALRALLTVLAGVLLPLAVVLALNLAGMSITTSSVACVVGAAGLALVCAATVWIPAGETVGTPSDPFVSSRRKSALGIVGAAAALIAALGLAVAIQPSASQRYTTLGFLDANAFTTNGYSAAPLAPVRVNWVLNGFGCDIVADMTTVQVQVDGAAVDDVLVDLGTVTSTPTSSALTGSATFPAAPQTGRHSVRITILTGTRDGSAVPQPGFITTTLEVRP
jgi:hypothetical protein